MNPRKSRYSSISLSAQVNATRMRVAFTWADKLIEEYLLFRGFMQTHRAFLGEMKHDRLHEFQVHIFVARVQSCSFSLSRTRPLSKGFSSRRPPFLPPSIRLSPTLSPSLPPIPPCPFPLFSCDHNMQVDKSVEELLRLLTSFQYHAMMDLWAFLHERFFSRLQVSYLSGTTKKKQLAHKTHEQNSRVGVFVWHLYTSTLVI